MPPSNSLFSFPCHGRLSTALGLGCRHPLCNFDLHLALERQVAEYTALVNMHNTSTGGTRGPPRGCYRPKASEAGGKKWGPVLFTRSEVCGAGFLAWRILWPVPGENGLRTGSKRRVGRMVEWGPLPVGVLHNPYCTVR